MAAIFAHDRIVIAFRVLLDHVADIAQGAAGFDDLDRFVHTLLGHLNQALRMGGRCAHKIHGAGVAMVSLINHCDVDINNVAIF